MTKKPKPMNTDKALTYKELSSYLRDKPKFPTSYKVVSQHHRKQMLSIIDQMSLSRSAITEKVQAGIADPSHIRWEFVLDKVEEDPPDGMTDTAEIMDYLTKNSSIYLKGTAGDYGRGRLIKFAKIDSVPATIAALFEQRAKLISGQRDEVVEEGTDLDDEPQGFITFQGHDDTLLAVYDKWYSQHPTADKRLYFAGREFVKHLMESASDTARRRI